jgi:hypothetical protein
MRPGLILLSLWASQTYSSGTCYQMAASGQPLSTSTQSVCLSAPDKGTITIKDGEKTVDSFGFHASGLVADCGPRCQWWQVVREDDSSLINFQLTTGGITVWEFIPRCDGVGNSLTLGTMSTAHGTFAIAQKQPSAVCAKWDHDQARIGIQLDKDARVIAVTTAGKLNKLKVGDQILALYTADGWVSLKNLKLTSSEIAEKIRGPAGTIASLVIGRDGEIFQVNLERVQSPIAY